ncbi:cyclic nucleotide-binding domain-containing protein [Hymenobacter sp. HSC-4F20]|uniref:cyclic nucleotide-binding domain-containing protein n=1 Tax=Hymenobacter sp. HSC-4F20 TaxID=2864135 RepID=UPI001C735662|nr:cyclic nucleotide-binding domain-containing protein [Hymenobacter sp. HSC-4F20]MBX0290481.1 cyclic nucleotide-binding domain-containing protein [Hymenobacter sp. HSC-4F20]
MDTWRQVLGVRAREATSVALFFLHHFLLGMGTILVYVVANVLLLEHQPERTLPLGYLLGALAMLGVGRVYAYLEHRWPLPTLARRGLMGVVGCTGLLAAVGLLADNSLPVAVALMAAYHLLYLLTNLELWSMSAVVFDVPQERHRVSLISSADLPAKALGAVLAILVCARAELGVLLLLAFGAYLGALYTQYLTFGSQVVEAHPAPRRPSPPGATPLPKWLLGYTPLVVCLGLSLFTLAAAGTGAEYFFFVHVKQRMLNQATVLQYVGSVLAFTYLLAMLGKLLLHHGLTWLGLPRTLLLLPVAALGGVVLLEGLRRLGVGAEGQLVYFCGLYLGLEVLRRAAFEPVFLVLFYSLSPARRLQSHALAKGICEPLGMGLAGLLLLAMQARPSANQWVAFAWMGALLLTAALLLRRAHHYYLAEQKTGLSIGESLDWSEQALPTEAAPGTSTTPLTAETALHDPSLAVRQQAIRALLTAELPSPAAAASLRQLAASDNAEQRQAALALLGLLPPAQQVTLLRTCLRSLEPDLTKAAVAAAAQHPTPEVLGVLLSLLEEKAARKPAADALVRMGNAALPALEAALQRQTNYPLLRRLAAVCARLATPASRRVLLILAQQPTLSRRAAALQALSRFDSVAADAPLFQHLMQKEMRLAQQLLHGMLGANVELRSCLKYELTKVQQRLFGLLLQLYDRQPILQAQRGIARTSQEHQVSALEILDNLIPRPLYQGLQALAESGRLSKKVQTFDQLLGPVPPESVLTTILHRGEEVFAPWTLSVALRQWQPTPATVGLLHTYLHSAQPLVRESAEGVLALLPARYPIVFEQWRSLYPTPESAPSPPPPTHIAAMDRLLLLRRTSLFAQTPENVLSSIVPIMKEVVFPDQHAIFAKGDLGVSLFIIYTGEVGIFTGDHQLATCREGDFFGELALLDAEPRSASAVAHGPIVAFRLDQEDFYDVMEECPEVLQNILRVLCQRLRQQNEELKTLARGAGVR